MGPVPKRSATDWIVQRDEFGAVGERRFDLHVVDHLRNTFHDVGTSQDVAAGIHDVDDGTTVPSGFENPIGQDGNGLRVIERKATSLPGSGNISGDMDEQTLLLVRAEMHCLTIAPVTKLCSGVHLLVTRAVSLHPKPVNS